MSGRYDIIVVGAGVAGLQCAHALTTDYGVRNVLVLEAAERVGGRIWGDRTWIPGVEVPFGAEIVHGDNTCITRLAKKEGWELSRVFTWAQGDGGPSETESPDGGAGYYYIGSEKRLVRFNRISSEMKHMHAVLWDLADLTDEEVATKYKGMNLRQYLTARGVVEPFLDMACAGCANTVAGTIDIVSVAGAVRQERIWCDDGDGDLALNPSTQLIIDTLKRGLNIRTSAPVSGIAVKPGSGCVEVTTRDGSKVQATAVVVAVPPPVLRDGDIAFNPPLAPSRIDAFRRINFANGAKLFLQLNKRVWPEDCHGMVCSQCPIPEMWFRTAMTSEGKETHIVTCFFMSDRADAITAMPEADAIQLALKQVCDIFGEGARSQFVSGKRMSWGQQPYIRGGYCNANVTELPGDRAIVATPHCERVLFAGEVYSPAYGFSPMTISGSMDTGTQAAKDAVKLLLKALPSKL